MATAGLKGTLGIKVLGLGMALLLTSGGGYPAWAAGASPSPQPSKAAPAVPAPAVTAPVLVHPADGVRADLRYFQWQEVRTAKEYHIQLSVVSDFREVAKEATVTGTRYVLPDPILRRAYWWRVQAVDMDGVGGPWSATRSVTNVWQDPDTGLEARPNNVRALRVDGSEYDPGRAARVGAPCVAEWNSPEHYVSCLEYQIPGNEIVLTWDRVPGAVSYSLEFNASATFPEASAVKCEIKRNRWTPYLSGPCAAALPGKPYVRVTAKDALGQMSTPSNMPTVDSNTIDGLVLKVVPAAPTPGFGSVFAPVTLAGPADGYTAPDVPTLYWPPVPGASWYQVGIFEDDSMTTTAAAAAPKIQTTNTSLVPADLFPDNNAGKSYHWFVVPCTEVGNPATCAAVSLVLGGVGTHLSFKKVGQPLVGLTSATLDSAWPVLTWTPRSAAADTPCAQATTSPPTTGCPGTPKYEVTVDELGSVTQAATEWVLSELPVVPGKTYTWRVRAVDTPAQPWAVSTFVAEKRATDLTLTVTPTSKLKVGSTMTFSARVLPAVATGRISFIDSGHTIATVDIDRGMADLTTTGVYGGKQTLQAIYPGSAVMKPSRSGTVKVKLKDKDRPKLSAVTVGGTAAAPDVVWTATDAGGVRWARIKLTVSGRSRGTRTVSAALGHWVADKVAKNAKVCATVRVTDWAGRKSKSVKKCAKLQ